MVVSRGFQGRPPPEPERLPPGQYLTRDVPVLATGPTPIDAAEDWSLGIRGAVERPRAWSWVELMAREDGGGIVQAVEPAPPTRVAAAVDDDRFSADLLAALTA